MEGFTHLIPFAAAHELIRQSRRHLTLYRMTPDLIYDQLIGMGAADRLEFSWGGNPGVGSLHRLRDAVENGWPAPLELIEHSHAAMASAYDAGTDLARVNGRVRMIRCPFTGDELAAAPAIRPDVSVIHAQKADAEGNVLLEGIVGVQKQAVLAAGRALVTVEEVVEELGARSPNAVILPTWTVTAIAVAPRGAHPSYAHRYYRRDNSFYIAWDGMIARDRDSFRAWMRTHVLEAGSRTVQA